MMLVSLAPYQTQQRRVFVTGIGSVSSFGRTVDTLIENVFLGNSSIRTISCMNTSDMRSKVGAEVPEDDVTFLTDRYGFGDRTTLFALGAVDDAIRFGRFTEPDVVKAGCAFASVGGLGMEAELERAASKFLESSTQTGAEKDRSVSSGGNEFSRIESESLPEAAIKRLQHEHRFEGELINFTTACAASANAVGYAYESICAGRSEIMFCGGAASLSRLTYVIFNSLRIHSTEACRPFDINRKGVVLGEAGACLVLESEESVRHRNAVPLAEVVSYGLAMDTHHVTEPQPEGIVIGQAVSDALNRGMVCEDKIGYVNAHGTGTKLNDIAEARGIQTILGSDVPVSSTKGSTGHCMEAAGALEAIITVSSLMQNRIPVNCGLCTKDPDCTIDVINSSNRTLDKDYALSISAGFGGVVAALVFKRV